MKDLSEKIGDCAEDGTAIIVIPTLDVGLQFLSLFEFADLLGFELPCDVSFHCLDFEK